MSTNAEKDMPLKWVYMQDDDLKHTCQGVKNWFLEKGIKVMDRSAQSPYLNRIETIWAVYRKKKKNQ